MCDTCHWPELARQLDDMIGSDAYPRSEPRLRKLRQDVENERHCTPGQCREVGEIECHLRRMPESSPFMTARKKTHQRARVVRVSRVGGSWKAAR